VNNRYSLALRQVAAAVTVSRTTIKWFGETVGRAKVAQRTEHAAWDVKDIEIQLQNVLYEYFYTQGRAVLRGEVSFLRGTTFPRSIVQSLMSANPGNGRREQGWKYVRAGRLPHSVVVCKNGIAVTAPRAAFDSLPEIASQEGCSEIFLRMPAGSINACPGFYVAHSDVEMDYAAPLARFYFNVTPAKAPIILRDVCEILNDQRVAFDFKIADDVAMFYRSDVAVLYLPRIAVRACLPSIRRIALKRRDAFRASVPAFVHELMPGLGAADNPEGAESFGMNRCRIISAALSAARDLRRPDDRYSAAVAAFHREGISLERPYLSPGLEDIYEKDDGQS